jgi:hypothetical protein
MYASMHAQISLVLKAKKKVEILLIPHLKKPS